MRKSLSLSNKMFFLALYNLFMAIIIAEKALPDYTKDIGMAPSWIDSNDHAKYIVDRWFVDKVDATCKPFRYLGSLVKFTQEEKAYACGSTHSKGLCDLEGTKAFTRWYFKTGEVGGKTNSCHEFKYSGCGGNANNFESEDECKNVCQNTENGGISGNPGADKLTEIPNEFDCSFIPEVISASPKMGIVPHRDGNRCVYAAIRADAKRGFFKDLPSCVKTCIKNKAPACSQNVPYQTPSTDDVTSGAKVYYYFKESKSVCLPFMSKPPEGDAKSDDGALNIFSSPELCASFCPATGNTGILKADKPCTEKVAGVITASDKYKLTRYYYDPSKSGGAGCTQFKFNGKEMNLNNFETTEACEGICKTPLSSG